MKVMTRALVIILLIMSVIMPLWAEGQEAEGINKNQPISPGQIIYCGQSPKGTASQYTINTYFFNGIDNNEIEIRCCKGSSPVLDIQNLSPAELNEKCDLVTVLFSRRMYFDVYDYIGACDCSLDGVFCFIGHKTLLIRAIEDSDKILVNEIETKPVPGLVYEEEYFKKTSKRNINTKE